MTSKRAWLLEKALRLAGTKAIFSDPARLKAHIVRQRKKKLAAPGKALRRKMHVQQYEQAGHPIFRLCSRPEPKRYILYIHGGAYVLGIQSVYWKFLADITDRTDAESVVACYPLAPESDCQSSYDWMMTVYDDLTEKTDSKNITIMGDSAGAGFTLGFAQMLRDKNKDLPGKLVLLSPWLDVTMTDPMQPAIERKDRILGIAGLRAAGEWWAGKSSQTDSSPVSPLFGDIAGLPDISVFTGTFDILWPDARKLKEKAEKSGIELDYHEYPAMQHVWMLFPIPEAKAVREKISGCIPETN